MSGKVLISVLMCDRKAHNMMIPIDDMINQDYSDKILYFNIETKNKDQWKPMFDRLDASGVEYYYDFWNLESSWWKNPKFDQDQARLVPICIGRNMSIDAALDLGAAWLMFVDSDMTFPVNSVSGLLSRGKKMIGGFVRGRNDHKHAEYIFGAINGIKDLGDGLIECDHGNIGFCLIKKDIFQYIRFRRGPADWDYGHLQSDDPNYCFDALNKWGFERHFVDKKIEAKHHDETVLPFKEGAQY
jgi:hypothetical protein